MFLLIMMLTLQILIVSFQDLLEANIKQGFERDTSVATGSLTATRKNRIVRVKTKRLSDNVGCVQIV